MDNNKTILIVEDDITLLDIISKALEKHFFVFKASNGHDALRIYDDNDIDCIILDIQMEPMDGLEVLKNIRSRDRRMPVIITTGHSQLEYAEKCADLGVNGYCTKPYGINHLVTKIQDVLSPLAKGKVPSCYMKYGHICQTCHPKVYETLHQMHENISDQIKLSTMSNKIGISCDYLGRLVKRDTGHSFTELLNKVRIDKAKELLAERDMPINTIVYDVGYNTEQHFFKQFKKFTGLTPNKFRKGNRS